VPDGTAPRRRQAAIAEPEAPAGRLFGSVLETVGRTPTVLLPRLSALAGLAARLALKLEVFNSLGSVKDRIGLAVVEAAEQEGLIAPGRSVLVEPTSGNTGIALAFVAAAKGYRPIVVMPDGASIELRKMMRHMGAELELTPARRGMTGAIARAEEIVATTPGAWMPRQFDNPAIHAATTAEEIWRDTGGEVDAVVGGIGTGGTLTGIATALKPRRPGLRIIGVEPRGKRRAEQRRARAAPHPGHRRGLPAEGARPRGARRGDPRLRARGDRRRAARSDGSRAGAGDGGAAVVAIAPSFAERYLSTELFEDP
jgi:cysteine synthase A